MKFALLTVLFLVSSTVITPTSAQIIPIQEQVNEVTSHLVGVMDTTAQAQANPNAPSVRMTTCKVTLIDTPNTVYLYQEQALTQKLTQPYRQRLLEIKPSENAQIVESKAYKFQNPEKLINFCRKTESERQLQASDLGESVCSVFLQPIPQGYIGQTPPQGCPTNVRGAVKITNIIILHSEGMDTWDRGYDAQGNQIWGAQGESYQYRWVKK